MSFPRTDDACKATSSLLQEQLIHALCQALFYMFYVYPFALSLQQCYETATVVILLREHSEAEWLSNLPKFRAYT